MDIHFISHLASLANQFPEGSTIILLYLGPETVMPIASILAGILGFLLIFWRLILKMVKKGFSSILKLFRKNAPDEEVSAEPVSENIEAK